MIRKLPKEIQLSTWVVQSLFPLLNAEEVKVYMYVAMLMSRVDDYFLMSTVRMSAGSINREGERVDYGTGLSLKVARKAFSSLVKYGVVTTERASPRAEIKYAVPKRVRLGTAKTIDLPGLKQRAKDDIERRAGIVSRLGQDTQIMQEEFDRIDSISIEGAPGREAEEFMEERGWTVGDNTYFGLPDPRRDTTPAPLKEARKRGLTDVQFRELVDAILDATNSRPMADVNIDVSFANRSLNSAQEAAVIFISYDRGTVKDVEEVTEKWNRSWMAEKRRQDGNASTPSFGDLVNQLRQMPPKATVAKTIRPKVELDEGDSVVNVMLPPKRKRSGE
jgi:hypothetical protein